MSFPPVVVRGAALAACCLLSLNVAAQTPQPTAADVPTVTTVAGAQRSTHFGVVNQHLALGGEFYLYADVEGDVDEVAKMMTQLYGHLPAEGTPPQLMFLRQDFEMLAELMGLSDVKAFGMSSVEAGEAGFENRAYLHFGGPREGLAAMLGGEPQVLTAARIAPADVVFFSTGTFDGRALFQTVRDIVERTAGPEAVKAMDQSLRRQALPLQVSMQDLIDHLHGEMTLFLSVDEKRPMQLNPQLEIPRPSFVLRFDNAGALLNARMADWEALPMVSFTEVNDLAMVTWKPQLPGAWADFTPALASDGRHLYLSNDGDYLQRCLILDLDRLADNPAVQEALAPFDGLANGLVWVSPELPRIWKDVLARSAAQGPQPNPMASMFEAIPSFEQPVIGVRKNLPEGVLYVAHSPYSHKRTLVTASIYNPVTIGLMASMAVPAFQKVRTSSQEKAVLNNLRMLAAASDQYFLETGRDSCTTEDIVGPLGYIEQLKSVAGESYRGMEFRVGQPLSVTLPDGRVIDYQR